MVEKIKKIRHDLRRAAPLVHCITNPISINQCANAILAVGARPIMAEHPQEVGEIYAPVRLFNLGNITDARMNSMRVLAPRGGYVLDAVGVAALSLRRALALELMPRAGMIKGNYSEICALCKADYRAEGVDSENLPRAAVEEYARALARKSRAPVLASGAVDIVTDGERLVLIKNGTPRLGEITGTGCMLGALAAAYMAVAEPFYAAVCACAVMGICGELADDARGGASFGVRLADCISTLSDVQIEDMLKTEEAL